MRVIKKAPGSKKVTKRFDCDQCEAVLEVSGRDLKFQDDAREGAAYTFKCPECEKVNWVDASLVPAAMRAAAIR